MTQIVKCVVVIMIRNDRYNCQRLVVVIIIKFLMETEKIAVSTELPILTSSSDGGHLELTTVITFTPWAWRAELPQLPELQPRSRY